MVERDSLYGQEKVRIGMFGCGTVGQGVVDYLGKFYDPGKTGLGIDLRRVCVRDASKQRQGLDSPLITSEPRDILEDPEIDVVVELMGGIHPAEEYLREALLRGKNVVTANKALLTAQRSEDNGGTYGSLLSIYALDSWGENHFGFEASVCGEIPVIATVSDLTSIRNVRGFKGIINGTSNYILTRMADGDTYEVALADAQRMGFAEADPSFDVDGYDAAQKLAILATIGFGGLVNVGDISCQGISDLLPIDFDAAGGWGYVIKPLSIARRQPNNGLELRVCPALVPLGEELAAIHNETNALSIHFTDREEPQTFVGKGAGGIPTARSVVSDIVRVSQASGPSRAFLYSSFTNYRPDFDVGVNGNVQSPYYLRLFARDVTGSLHKIAGVLAGKSISINKMEQEGDSRNGSGLSPITILSHPSPERQVQEAICELRKLPVVENVLGLRVES